jgi:hypothetical protein
MKEFSLFTKSASIQKGEPLMDEPARSLRKIVSVAGLVVIGVVVLLPVTLLLAVAYYIAALAQGVWSLVGLLTGRKPPPAPSEPLPRPHLWEIRAQGEGQDQHSV